MQLGGFVSRPWMASIDKSWCEWATNISSHYVDNSAVCITCGNSIFETKTTTFFNEKVEDTVCTQCGESLGA